MYVLYNQEHFDILFDSCLKEGELFFHFIIYLYQYLYKVFHVMVGLTVY